MGGLQGGKHLYSFPPGHVFSAAPALAEGRSVVQEAQQDGEKDNSSIRSRQGRGQPQQMAEMKTHTGLCCMTSCQLAFLEKTTELPYNDTHPLYFVFLSFSLFITFVGLEAQEERLCISSF